jgi:hypothetical protein
VIGGVIGSFVGDAIRNGGHDWYWITFGFYMGALIGALVCAVINCWAIGVSIAGMCGGVFGSFIIILVSIDKNIVITLIGGGICGIIGTGIGMKLGRYVRNAQEKQTDSK